METNPIADKAMKDFTDSLIKRCDGFGVLKCDDCATDIVVNETMQVFMMPAQYQYKVKAVCMTCLRRLMLQFDYSNKN